MELINYAWRVDKRKEFATSACLMEKFKTEITDFDLEILITIPSVINELKQRMNVDLFFFPNIT